MMVRMDPHPAIVAAVDFSEDARHAAARAATLAAQRKAPLRLVHVVEPRGLDAVRQWLGARADLPAVLVQQARDRLQALADDVRRDHGIDAAVEVRTGEALEELEAAVSGAQLLALGVQGLHPVRELVLGSTADRIIRSAHRPVLVVKQPPARPYRQLLVLLDLSAASEKALRSALRLAPEAAVRLLHAFEVPYEGQLRLAGVSEGEIDAFRAEARRQATDGIAAVLARTGERQRITASVEAADVRIELRRVLEDLRPDLVVVAKHSRSAVSDLFLGSVTRVVLAEAPCDVLVVPPQAP